MDTRPRAQSTRTNFYTRTYPPFRREDAGNFRLVQDLADVQHLLRLPETDRAEVRGYFEKAGLLEWYDRLVATL